MKWHVEKNLFHLIVPGKTDLVLPTGLKAFTNKMETEPVVSDSQMEKNKSSCMDMRKTAILLTPRTTPESDLRTAFRSPSIPLHKYTALKMMYS